jgi:hypothetical protein
MAQRNSTQAKLRRLNQRIKRLDPSKTKQRNRLIKRRGVLQRRRGNEILSNPNAVASGRTARYAARSLERLTNKPGIDAQKNLIKSLGQMTNRDVGKLEAMGGRLGEQMNYLTGRMDQYGQEAYDRSVATGDQLTSRLRENSENAMNRTNQLQSSVLGQQISSLQGANVSPGSSGQAGIMGQFAQAQNQAAANNAASWQNLGAAMAGANTAATEAGTTAARNSLDNKSLDIQRNITTRVSDRMFQGSQAEQEARAKLATLQSLRGAEYVNQLMKLRGTERDFINSRQANALERLAIETQARGDRAGRAIDQYEAETDRIEAMADGGSGGSGGSGGEDNDARLSPKERRSFHAAAETRRQALPGGKIGNWGAFFDEVAKQEGVSWSPQERRQFAKKYKRWYRKNK